MIRTWISQYQQGTLTGSLGVSKLSAEQLRIRVLERELAIAREERDILKKAAGDSKHELLIAPNYLDR